jgi:L-threonylcarbamoyladenylate synthase
MPHGGAAMRGSALVVSPEAGISAAAALLAVGEVVALPTETVYGLGAAALDPTACARIFEAKERPLSDPLIVHVPGIAWLDRLAEVSPLARDLAFRFWPGPLTLVLPRKDGVPDIVTAGQETVAVRMSAHPVFQAVLQAYGKPVAAPSANRFGRISPTSAQDVLAELGDRIPLILDGGPCLHGVESTIVLVRGDELHILRHGPITTEELGEFGPVRGSVVGLSAPGGLASHYAPRTPLVIGDPVPSARTGLLAWRGSGEGFEQVEFLSRTHDLREAAANLYAGMRRLDGAGLERILAEPVPEHGLGAAIMERLRKAAVR